jgi:4-amino-4-deoxy-L-arabinose transferase-like glycosyltransferase
MKLSNNTAVLVTILFVFAACIRLVYLYFFIGFEAPLTGDMPDYYNRAVNIISGAGFRHYSGAGWDYSSRPPLTSFYLAGFFTVFGVSVNIARIGMIFISSLSIPLIYWFCYKSLKLDKNIAILSSVIWSLYPPSIYYSGLVLTENIANILSLLVVISIVEMIRSGRIWIGLFTGVIIGLATLNRPIYLLFVLALPLGSILFTKKIQFKWRLWAISMVGFILALAPWTIRNYNIHHSFMPTTSYLGGMLLMCNGTLENKDIQRGMYFKNPLHKLIVSQGNNEVERSKIATTLAINEIVEKWYLLPNAMLNRALNFWTFRPNPFKTHWTNSDLVMFVVWVPTFLLFIVSFMYYSVNNDWPALFMILYTLSLIIMFWGTPRFRYPIEPFIVVRATITFYFIMNRFPQIKRYLAYK